VARFYGPITEPVFRGEGEEGKHTKESSGKARGELQRPADWTAKVHKGLIFSAHILAEKQLVFFSVDSPYREK
jgi:hypothetical protein